MPTKRYYVSNNSKTTYFTDFIFFGKVLPDRESNPGLPRDRRGYSPLYYRGMKIIAALLYLFEIVSSKTGNALKIAKTTKVIFAVFDIHLALYF